MAAHAVLPILDNGEIELEGQFLWGSNYTLLVKVNCEGETIDAVYKPSRGERPLWDFPRSTLALREVAAYLVSDALGWDFVPPTVFREAGPMGEGSLQMHVEHDPDHHFFNFNMAETESLRAASLFDVLINNADRKGGHFIVDDEDKIWLIDHGICFHPDPKLRTVLWNFAGERLPERLCADLQTFAAQLTPEAEIFHQLAACLSHREIDAMAHRADYLLESGIFPAPPDNARPYPWPLV
jgi:uncharacterized repeat protein (TIGR03843 family)